MSTWALERRPAVESDANVVRAAAWARLALLCCASALASVLGTHGHDALVLGLGLVWIPWATVVLLAADDPGRRLALVGGPVGDLIGLLIVQMSAPEDARAVLFGYLVVVTFATFTAGRLVASTLGTATIGLSALLSAQSSSPDRLRPSDLIPFSLALGAAVLLARRSLSVHALASARAESLRTKADVILATAVGGVVVTDERGLVLESNPAAQRIVAATDDIVGRHCADVLALHMGARALDCTQGCPLLRLHDHDASQGVEVWRTGPTGEKQPVLARAVTISTTERTEVVHSLQDITRLKQAEEAKTLFLATASHELKTPLTVINGFAETLSTYEDLDRETQRVALSAILSRGKQLTRVVDRLLLSSRIDAGKVSVVTGPVRLGPILVERADGFSQATGRTIVCDVPDDLEEACGETDALITVVDHLLENALKYSPDGGEVKVSAATDADRVVFKVRDRGIGMDADQAAHCFEKFWQAESTDVRRFGGTGIGLYIVHSLVDAMGGRIRVDSAPARGTTFAVELSLARAIPAPRDAGQIREFMRQIGVPSVSGP